MRARAAVAGAVAGAVLAAVLVARAASDDGAVVEHPGPPAFSLAFAPDVLRRAPPLPGELARLRGAGVTLAVRRLDPRDATFAALPVAAERIAGARRRRLPGFTVRMEGHVPVEDAAGYRLRWRADRLIGLDLLLARSGAGLVLSLRRPARGGTAAAAAARAALDSARLTR